MLYETNHYISKWKKATWHSPNVGSVFFGTANKESPFYH